jgi:UPF0716 protein FxsA
MRYLLFLFIVVPLVEFFLLYWVTQKINLSKTILLVVVTGFIGSILARRQGWGIWQRVRSQMNQGQIPGAEIFDGVLVFVAGALLITPGIITDAVGFLLLIPITRTGIRRVMINYLKRQSEFKMYTGPMPTWTQAHGEATVDSYAVESDEQDETQAIE